MKQDPIAAQANVRRSRTLSEHASGRSHNLVLLV